ncbi:MAG: hypothetical protein HUN05_11465 [Desulfobacter sp.]|nr:MAG: hypothetical protein HUN05_11465 [Desulfobacter sp.]
MRFITIPMAGLILWQASMVQAMRIFFEATTQIKKLSLDSPGAGQTTTAAIKAYMQSHDPYGRYLSAKEYKAWKQAQNFAFHGIGMEILERNGRFYCLPRPLSQALTAGVQQGDELIGVDDQPVAGRSIYWVGTQIRGEKNTQVKLKIAHNTRTKELTIKRYPMTDQSVWQSTQNGLFIVRISHFSSQTLAQIKAVLASVPKTARLVLDLRNNPGGDLFAAVDIAGLFLPLGSKIMTLETNQGKIDYHAKGRIWTGRKIAIWQNSFTASASEVLIAALVGHHTALNFGTPSHGKAMTQKVVVLSDGSALVISRGRLYGPGHIFWQTKGLAPRVEIQPKNTAWAGITQEKLK